MVNAVNALKNRNNLLPPPIPNSSFLIPNFIVSVDLPSGNFDEWEHGMSIIQADITLAIEPQKNCIYSPAARPYAGIILPVEGIFPRELIAKYKGPELLNWDNAMERVSKIRADTYKNKRGTIELWAGSPGATGAAFIAARGAQAAGAGLIRLVADDDIYTILASQAAGIMVVPAFPENAFNGKRDFLPDALVLGPGWGKTKDRAQILQMAYGMEKEGIPLILDADAIELVRDKVFNGNAILTPHPGELHKYTGIEQKDFMSCPAPLLLKYARQYNATILFKGHVIIIASPDGRLGVIDGMTPGLASGGSGDLLAGFCGAIAARMKRENKFDAYTCAAAAAALLIAAGKSKGMVNRFTDPLELAHTAADLAGAAWLGQASGG
jgi:NAD(P)H-hydrate epimerase